MISLAVIAVRARLIDYVYLAPSLLSYRMQPKPVEAAHPEPERDRDYHTRISNAVSNSIFQIGDLFRDGQKGVRFPKDLIKVLEQKLQDIAMGRDPA